MELTGIHHLTAVTANAAGNRAFYTETLGLRLVKKTVNQDDVSAYHLFYADGEASPGTDITFFDWPAARERRGTRSVVRTGFRVPPGDSLEWWRDRLASLQVAAEAPSIRAGRRVLDFEDPEGQRLSLVEDDGDAPAHPWKRSPVPLRHQIRGLGPIALSVPSLAATESVLTGLMNMRKVGGGKAEDGGRKTEDGGRKTEDGGGKAEDREMHVYHMGPGGAAAELQVFVEPQAPLARSGAGGVHHVAFRVPTVEEYKAWAARLAELAVPNSGPVDRFYFKSLYFREPNGILFELATDGPGFAVDEPADSLGERLALPPFLEGRRAEIEAGLKPI